VVGGIIILAVERHAVAARYHRAEAVPLPLALKIGLCQVIAMIPGVSRSGATILGAVLMGVDRRAAAEFSFFLAIPTMLGATALDLFKARHFLTSEHLLVIGLGFVCSFLAALLVVRALVAYLSRHTFKIFGWYRIVIGTLMVVVLTTYGAAVPGVADLAPGGTSPPSANERMVEPIGIEPTTPCLQSRCSPS
jgi:undecaprenyl-diphosphatase